MFLATEGLYAEALRRPGLVDSVQREHRIVIAGPTTLVALLNSLQVGFRTLSKNGLVRCGKFSVRSRPNLTPSVRSSRKFKASTSNERH